MQEETKVGGVIVTHGLLAKELLAAASQIAGELPHIAAVSIGWQDEVSEAQKQIREALKTVENGSGAVILTDMFGGTPTNISAMFLGEQNVEIITGVNLPMVIKLAMQPAAVTLDELTKQIQMQGKDGIQTASDFLAPKRKT